MVPKNFATALLHKERNQIEDAFDIGAVRDSTGKKYFEGTYGRAED